MQNRCVPLQTFMIHCTNPDVSGHSRNLLVSELGLPVSDSEQQTQRCGNGFLALAYFLIHPNRILMSY